MKVVVFGASGKVGQVVVETLLEREHQVRAFIHKSNPYEEIRRVEIVKGDIHQLDDVKRAVIGVDAVISVVSSWKAKDKDALSFGIENILKAIKGRNDARIVSLTGNLAKGSGEKFPLPFSLARLAMLIFAKGVLKDAENHIKSLEISKKNWVVVRSPIITGSRRCRGYELSIYPKFVATKAVGCVANSLVDLAQNKNSNHQRKLLFIT
jgi:nucleoside-diphosphate-sugar epimerase